MKLYIKNLFCGSILSSPIRITWPACPSLLNLLSFMIFRYFCRGFPFLKSVQTGPGADPTFYSVDTAVPYAEVKWPESEADHSFPSSAEVKNWWSYNSTPPTYLFGVHRDNLLRTIQQHKWQYGPLEWKFLTNFFMSVHRHLITN
jgi:hypothetical protein